MAKQLIAKSPIGYAGHLLSPGDNVREYINDAAYIALLIEKGHAEEVEVEPAAPAEVQEQATPADEQQPEDPQSETPAAETEEKPEAPEQSAPRKRK